MTKADVGYAFPGDGQIPYARGLIEFELTYKSDWPPVGGVDLAGVVVEVGSDPDTSFPQVFDLQPRRGTP